MKGLEGQELRKSRLPWPSLPSAALTPAFGLLRSQLQCTVPGTSSAEALNQGFPKVQEKVLRKVSITEDQPCLPPVEGRPGQQHGTGWKDSQRQFAVLMPVCG